MWQVDISKIWNIRKISQCVYVVLCEENVTEKSHINVLLRSCHYIYLTSIQIYWYWGKIRVRLSCFKT